MLVDLVEIIAQSIMVLEVVVYMMPVLMEVIVQILEHQEEVGLDIPLLMVLLLIMLVVVAVDQVVLLEEKLLLV